MNSFAPVLIPTLNRYDHLIRCVESLSKCTHSENTVLYIALDYPFNDSHWEGYTKIEKYITYIKGFKSVIIIKRDVNYGALNNIVDARNTIFEEYDRFILSEDDNQFSPNFLDYINKGLDKFENDENVYAICGYQFPLKLPLLNEGNYYFYRSLSAWGYGSWRKKYKTFYYTNNELIKFSKDWQLVKSIIRRNPNHFSIFINAIQNNRAFYGDMAIGLYMAIHKNVHCVFPYISKVRNNGHDGSGINCGTANNYLYSNQIIDDSLEFEFTNQIFIVKNNLGEELNKYFSLNIKSTIRALILYAILRIKHSKIFK